jgi:OOP family OmpA-OmpF porin
MKLTRLALAALMLPSSIMVANAGVTVTPLVGYSWYPENVQKTQRQEMLRNRDAVGSPNGFPNYPAGVALTSDVTAGLAIGVELTPWLQGEVEYQQTKTDAQQNEAGPSFDAKQETLSGNLIATADVLTGNYDSKFKPYVLGGGGYQKTEVEKPGKNYRSKDGDPIVNLGAGAFYQLNDALSLRGEGRAVYNIDKDIWVPQALAGLQVVLGGHLKPAAPVAPVEPVAPPVVVEAPKQVEPPKELTEDLKMELRVFFDINKSNIKAQYKPEVAKVAEKLAEYPNATAKIEGHTDNTGPRKLNERLSLARANAVKSLLVSEFNVDANRLTTEGYAWDRPIASNKTREGRAMNRRAYAIITGSRTVLVPADQAAQ